MEQDAPARIGGEKLTWRQRLKLMRFEMSSANLKIYGCVTAFFYTLSMTVIQRGLIRMQDFAPGELSEAMASDGRLMMLSTWGSLFQLIGGLSIPVFAFLLAEGFSRTKNLKKYLYNLIIFAIISEVPYDFAMSGKVWDFSSQNVMFSYIICLVMLYGLRLFQGQRGFRFWVVRAVVVLASVLWAQLLRAQFGLITVVLCAIYYIWYDSKGLRVILGAAVSITYVTAPLSAYALYKFNGERGRVRNRYIYYALYPLHLIILGVMARWMAR